MIRRRAPARPGVSGHLEEAVAELDLSAGDVRSVMAAVAARRSRPIQLVSGHAVIDQGCGLWMATDHGDHIMYDASVPLEQQRQLLFHELAHVILSHRGRSIAEIVASSGRVPELSSRMIEHVLGDVGAVTILCRNTVTDQEENDAKAVATLLAAVAMGPEAASAGGLGCETSAGPSRGSLRGGS